MRLDYTTTARRLSYRYPVLTGISVQVNFWIAAYLIFFLLLYFISKGITTLYLAETEVHMGKNVTIAVITAVIFGTILGIIDYMTEKKFRSKSLGIEILLKGVLYVIAWHFIMFISSKIGFAIEAKFIEGPELVYTDAFATNIYYASSIYTAVIIVVISFIRQMNIKFGPGVLVPMLLGKFRKPGVEERIFIFMDLKDSTSYAEKLGHIKYSELIQDCFMDVNKVIPKYNAEIYQYVGDEVVLSWTTGEGLSDLNCIEFLFGFLLYQQNRKQYYVEKYGFLPEFKAGSNIGQVTVAEIGDIKREIAYHGDTVNTASRIQQVCSNYGVSFLISQRLKERVKWNNSFELKLVDSIILKGKEREINLYSVNKTE